MPRTPNDEGSKPTGNLQERLDQLESKLNKADETLREPDSGADSTQSAKNRAGIAQAFRLSSEFIAGVVAGAGIGYLIDTFFGTSPWGMIIFLMLGFAAAVLNVMRAAGMVAESEMRLKPAYELQKKQHEDETGKTSEK